MADAAGGIAPGSVPVRRLDARIRKLAESVLVAGPREVRELSDTASFVWDRIDGRRTVAEIGEALAAEYDVDVTTATGDVAELVGELVAVEVVTLRTP